MYRPGETDNTKPLTDLWQPSRLEQKALIYDVSGYDASITHPAQYPIVKQVEYKVELTDPVCPALVETSIVRSRYSLVLDIDNTCVKTFMGRDSKFILYGQLERNNFPQSRLYTGTVDDEKFWGIMRPYLQPFLKWADGYFQKVYIWTAGVESYAYEMNKIMYRGMTPLPANRVFSRKHCVSIDDVENTKPLHHLIAHEGLRWEDVIMMDDRKDVTRFNVSNTINIPEFDPKTYEEIQFCDMALPQVIRWFNKDNVRYASNIQWTDKSQIFI